MVVGLKGHYSATVILISVLRQVYVLTVIGPTGNGGGLALRGLFIGDDEECFKAASKLSLEVNFTLVPRPIQKVRFGAKIDAEQTRLKCMFLRSLSARHICPDVGSFLWAYFLVFSLGTSP